MQRRLQELAALLLTASSVCSFSCATSAGSQASPAGQLGSIGAVLGQSRTDGRVTIREAPPGYPAAQAGLGPGDELLLIDGRDVRAMTPAAIHQALEGNVGTAVRLTLFRRGKVLRVALERVPLAPR